MPDISKEQISKGTKHEMEHTNNPKTARRIAMDHLKEYPTYYNFLEKMEKRMDKNA